MIVFSCSKRGERRSLPGTPPRRSRRERAGRIPHCRLQACAGSSASFPEPFPPQNAAAPAARFTPSEGYRSFFRALRSSFRPAKLEDAVSHEALNGARVLVVAAPREPFSEAECKAILDFNKLGGSLLFFASDGGDAAANSNLNFLLEKFHVSVNSDCCLCTVVNMELQYLHPKEVPTAHPPAHPLPTPLVYVRVE